MMKLPLRAMPLKLEHFHRYATRRLSFHFTHALFSRLVTNRLFSSMGLLRINITTK